MTPQRVDPLIPFVYYQAQDYSDKHISYKKGYYHLDETEDLCGPYTTLEACRLALADLQQALKG